MSLRAAPIMASATALARAPAPANNLDPTSTYTVGSGPIVAGSSRPQQQSDLRPDPTLASEVRRVIRSHLPTSWRERELGDDVTLGAEGLALDSVSFLDAVLALEDAFRIELPIERLPASSPTLGALVSLVAETIAAQKRG